MGILDRLKRLSIELSIMLSSIEIDTYQAVEDILNAVKKGNFTLIRAQLLLALRDES